jgi:signal transduction histidine kinase
VEDGLRSSRHALEAAGCVVEKDFESGLPLILADESAFRHAIQNLIENAVRYGISESKWIGVFACTVVRGGLPWIEIRVCDRGPGIPADEQQHIFDPFFRGRRAIQDQIHGTGLGLNLVQRIVAAHGGTIQVKSEPMKGTEFIVLIPTAPPEIQHELAHSIG